MYVPYARTDAHAWTYARAGFGKVFGILTTEHTFLLQNIHSYYRTYILTTGHTHTQALEKCPVIRCVCVCSVARERPLSLENTFFENAL